jgi:hypothetical protein
LLRRREIMREIMSRCLTEADDEVRQSHHFMRTSLGSTAI